MNNHIEVKREDAIVIAQLLVKHGYQVKLWSDDEQLAEGSEGYWVIEYCQPEFDGMRFELIEC